jgi:flagellar hook-associated protein 3 FlgL
VRRWNWRSTRSTSVDVAAVTAKLSTYQAQLTSSYAAIAKVQSLNLASYLS